MSHKPQRIYRRTDAGRDALEQAGQGLSGVHRLLLSITEDDTHAEVVRKRMRGITDAQITHALELLEQRQLITSRPDEQDHDLDFTGTFSLAELMPKSQAN